MGISDDILFLLEQKEAGLVAVVIDMLDTRALGAQQAQTSNVALGDRVEHGRHAVGVDDGRVGAAPQQVLHAPSVV